MGAHTDRIGIDVKTLALHGGGISAALRTLLPHLVERLPDVDWVAFGPAASLDALPCRLRGIPIELVRGVGGIRLPVYDQWQVRRAASAEGLSLFYSPYFDAPAFLRVPTVVTMHDAVHLRFPRLYPRAQRTYYAGLMRTHARQAAAIITDSEFSRNELLSLTSVDPARLHVVGIPLGDAFLRRAQQPTSAPEGAGRYALYPGGVEARKNLSTLFAAWALWRRSRHDLPTLALTGDASRYAGFREQIARLGIGDRVRFVGRLSDEDMVEAYARAAFIVYPSLYEGFGLPVVEGQAAGVPVACSDRAALREVGGDAALYFDPDSPEEMVRAFDRLMMDDAFAAALVVRGRARARHFTAARVADRLAAVLGGLLEAA